MPVDLYAEAEAALDAATVEVNACPNHQVKPSLIRLVDAVAAVMRLTGVPNAVEPETGKAAVTAHTETGKAKAKK